MAEYTYSNDRDRQLLSLDYGNGDKVQYTYDSQGRVIKETYEDGDTVTHALHEMGLSIRQISRLTGLSKKLVERNI